jgi:hypothetical protein
MLFINDHPIWFHEPEGEGGNNCDFILLAYGMAINAETKCNLETPDINFATLKNSLQKARGQLPSGAPGVVFVKLPAQWVTQPEFAKWPEFHPPGPRANVTIAPQQLKH